MGTKARLSVFLAAVIIAIYVAWSLLPPRFHNSQLRDDLDDIVRRVTYTPISDDDIKRLVIAKAQSEGIVLKEDQITVARSNLGVIITVRYRVHVDMIVYQTDLDFTASSHNKMIGT